MAVQRSAKSGKNTPWTPEKVRERIKTSVIANRLMKHVLGQLELSPTQVRAAEILLRKCLPDLSAVEHSGETTHRSISELSRAELLVIAAGGSSGATEEARSGDESSGIH